jgi:alanyl-tRNA synthetase
MTERLYYRDSFLYEFDAKVLDTVATSGSDPRTAIILDRTAFYPTSGGQVFDTGEILLTATNSHLRVAEVAERDDGTILHVLQDSTSVPKAIRIRGLIDEDRRRDHMQQHSGQHVLSAAFVRLFELRTVSFHMGADYCSIDLDAKSLNLKQVEAAEALANEVVQENRPVEIRFVTQEEARGLGLRKLPPVQKAELRLIDIRDFDVTACGGTHVHGTAQIGSILLRKTEKVRQGWRVEFVCGKRAVSTARRDYTTLSDAAGVLSTHLWEVPQQIQKLQEESRASRKSREQLHEEMAGLHAERMLSEAGEIGGRKIIARTFPDRDLGFIKMLA